MPRMPELLSFSNLTPFRKRYAKNLSGGMKQKLGLACTLIHTLRESFSLMSPPEVLIRCRAAISGASFTGF